MKDYYRILQVHPDASEEIIDQAYKALARKHHPDAHPPEKQALANRKMQEINEARAVLMDPVRRAEYIRSRRIQVLRTFWSEGLTGLARMWASKG